MHKDKSLIISVLLVIICISIGVLLGYFITTSVFERDNKQDNQEIQESEKEENNNNENTPQEEEKEEVFNEEDVLEFINNSLVSYYLDTQTEDVSDVVSFLKKYDNNDKLLDIIIELNQDNIELTKTNILNKEKELFGMNTDLVFKDVLGYDGQVLYTYDSVSEDYLYDYTGTGFCTYSTYNKIDDIKKSGANYVVTVTKAWSDAACEGPTSGIFANFQDAENRTNPIIDYENVGYENAETYEQQYNLVFSDTDIISKLDKYEYTITYDNRYIIKSYKKLT